jgi:hypothetical protein
MRQKTQRGRTGRSHVAPGGSWVFWGVGVGAQSAESLLVPHSQLSNSTIVKPRPLMSMTSGVDGITAEVDPSWMSSSTDPAALERVTAKGVCACATALVASSLTTSRKSSTRCDRWCASR